MAQACDAVAHVMDPLSPPALRIMHVILIIITMLQAFNNHDCVAPPPLPPAPHTT